MDNKQRINIDWARNPNNPAKIVVGASARRGCLGRANTTERQPMHRLPGGDRATSGSELAVVLGLGLVGMALIGASFAGSLRFAIHRDGIIAAVAGETPAAVTANAERAKTNVAVSTPDGLQIPTPNRQPSATPGCPTVQSL